MTEKCKCNNPKFAITNEEQTYERPGFKEW